MITIVYDCKNERVLYRTLIEVHTYCVKYEVTSTEDVKGKITFHVICHVDPAIEAVFRRAVYSHVHA